MKWIKAPLSISNYRFKMKKILLIEDNLEVRENTAEILELADFEVVTAENGKEGIKLAQQHLPDIIICDIMMPVMDGYDTIYFLSQNENTKNIPFIFLTAKTEMDDLRKGMNLGADDYLIKPFSEADLLKSIEIRLTKKTTAPKNTKTNKLKSIDDIINSEVSHQIQKFNKKDVVFNEGSSPIYLYYVNKGKIGAYRSNKDGKTLLTSVYSKGDYFGYTALFNEQHYPETTKAMEASELVLITKNEFEELLYNNDAVNRDFLSMLTHNIEHRKDEMIRLAYDSVKRRVADSLVLLMNIERKNNPNADYFTITRSDLANLVGTASESVIRTLSEFKEDGLIEMRQKEIKILKPDLLQKLPY